jgi:Kef-type K+ transport system membrane component KefB
MSLYNGNVFPSVISLLLVQIIFIKCLSYLLHFLFRPLKQPLVISEIVCGIILGPSVLGFIPNYTKTLFPPTSVQELNEIAQLTLVIYLFLVGLSLNPEKIKKNIKISILGIYIYI